MINRIVVTGSALGLGLSLLAALPQREDPGQILRDSLTVRESFAGLISYRTPTGATRTVNVTLRQVAINGGVVLQFPDSGPLVVQLGAGDVTTVIAGQRRVRAPDEFWTVPGGASMQVEIGREQAVLEVLSLRQR